MLKQISKLEGFKKLKKKNLVKINAGGKRCNEHCSYSGQRCYSNGHCGCPGECSNWPGGGLHCI